MPHERSLVQQYAGKPFVLLGINGDSDRENVKKRAVEESITWRSWWNGGSDGPLTRQWRVGMWPSFFLIDAVGRIRCKSDAIQSTDDLDRAVASLVHEAESRP